MFESKNSNHSTFLGVVAKTVGRDQQTSSGQREKGKNLFFKEFSPNVQKQKDANLRLFVDFADQPTNIAGTSSGTTERRQTLEQEFERQHTLISELESQLSAINHNHGKMAEELTGKVAALEAENQVLNQKLKDAEELQLRRKNSV